ncbi:hypothetical protein FHS31_002016 [Sphingomonas vulcanisoli]|uniref:Ice-binding protein C-terminal domain-containing protein n=1 Tax=Sphingomonas vulcanisoli TaxID=1658060 RepID=A0ABX0TUL2_9SPHN|nr:PEPxxWA-CTERM sorting domain-containing protein [Sphingomonas vulcanisoli]NIJ08399.1 hypothetical protein [Sphingomonas vulcanisoli]
MAAQIANGTVSFVDLGQPDVNYTVDPSTVTFSNGTFQVNGIGGFAGAKNGTGSLSGTLAFSATEGTTLNESLSNFFTFSDGAGANFLFSVDSVLTKAYSIAANSQSFSLYLLGSTVNPTQGLTATPTSLTVSFNQTGSSGYSASGTLAVPPASAVPEPASWAMMVGGFGLLGATLRRKRSNALVSFS